MSMRGGNGAEENEIPYKVNEKSLARLEEWLEKTDAASYKATKMKRHREGRSTYIQPGDVYYGDAYFVPHPHTQEKCLTFGRGMFSDRMWTSPVLSARKAPNQTDVWFVKTYNSIYKLEIQKR